MFLAICLILDQSQPFAHLDSQSALQLQKEARQKDFQKGSCGHQKMQAERPQRGLLS